MHRLYANDVDLARAKDLLFSGELLIVPTETVWGVAALANHSAAVEKLSQLKSRPKESPFSVMVHEVSCVKDLWENGRDGQHAIALAEHFWPGPLTLIAPLQKDAPILTQLCPQGTVGIRVPRHSSLLALLKEVGVPLAVSSANLRGQAAPTLLTEVILPGVDWVFDVPVNGTGLASTVASLSEGGLQVLRYGGVDALELRRVFEKGFVT